jgi:hypothetical protein
MAGNFQQKELSGVLFKNSYKEKPNQPDYSGECLIDGETYKIAGWAKKSAAGNPYMSLAFSVKEEQRPTPDGKVDLDDDLPF